MITDRVRVTVIEANSNIVLTRDLMMIEPQVMGRLSGPSVIRFAIPHGEALNSSYGITWKAWGQWIIVEMEIDYERRIVGCCITRDCKINPENGNMEIEAIGFSDYAKGIPWLENWNDIAVDPFEIVQRIWSHLQSTSNAQLGVEVLPASSGTLMLPGYGFDGVILVFEFFALFIRAVDFVDCGDYIEGLSRDIPFDYMEEAEWNEDRTEVNKVLRLAYPSRGVQQPYLEFRVGENVIQAELAEEKEVEWVSDVIIRGWFPGKVYSSRLGNSDLTRFRRTIMEEDAKINSTERAAAWAKRKLQRRTVPKYWKKVIIDPDHSNAPFGTWELGDSVLVRGEYPWLGEISEWHRIMAWTYDEASRSMELELKVEGAFNYDPIEYDPDPGDNPTEDTNRLSNGYFDRNLGGWNALQGSWIRVASMGFDTEGYVRIDCDDGGERLMSHKVNVTPGEDLSVRCAVRWQDLETTGSGTAFVLRVFTYLAGGLIGTVDIDTVEDPSTNSTGWTVLQDTFWTVPGGIDQIAVQLTVESYVEDGVAFWDDVRVDPVT